MFASTWLQLTATVSNNSLSAVARIYIQVSRELTTIVNIRSPPRVLFVYEQNLASPRFQSGRPSTRLAMMLRCTSFVPP